MLISPEELLKSALANDAAPLVAPSADASAMLKVLFADKSPPPANGLVVLIVLLVPIASVMP